jgi:hypothetical protein
VRITHHKNKKEENKVIKEEVQKKETVITNTEETSTTKINNEVTEFAQDTDSFVTYNIHIMQDIDTIDAICTKYNTTTNILSEYNDLTSLSTGDKLIIPEIDE